MASHKVDVELIHKFSSGGGTFFTREDGKDITLPTRFLEFDAETPNGTAVTVTMPHWLAYNEGLI